MSVSLRLFFTRLHTNPLFSITKVSLYDGPQALYEDNTSAGEPGNKYPLSRDYKSDKCFIISVYAWKLFELKVYINSFPNLDFELIAQHLELRQDMHFFLRTMPYSHLSESVQCPPKFQGQVKLPQVQ